MIFMSKNLTIFYKNAPHLHPSQLPRNLQTEALVLCTLSIPPILSIMLTNPTKTSKPISYSTILINSAYHKQTKRNLFIQSGLSRMIILTRQKVEYPRFIHSNVSKKIIKNNQKAYKPHHYPESYESHCLH